MSGSPARLGAFVLTYNRPEAVERSIRAIMSQTKPPDTLFIVDNGIPGPTAAVIELLNDDRVVHEPTGSNLGSAGGTEYGFRLLLERGFDLLYGGDDDNPPRTPDTFARLLDLLERAGKNVGGVGTVGARFDWHRGELKRFDDSELEGDLDVDFIGGDQRQLFTRAAIDKAGPPDGRLFFGYPDLEHCLRIRSAGFRLVIDSEIMQEYRQLTGRTQMQQPRSAVPHRPVSAVWRNYYTTRNYIWMMREEFDRPNLARREALKSLGRSAACWRRGIAYGREFVPLQIRGVIDGYRGRLGPVVQPRTKANRLGD
jgi:GT2 family glycosyltransferase